MNPKRSLLVRSLVVLVPVALSAGALSWSRASASPAPSAPANDALAAAMDQMKDAVEAMGKGITKDNQLAVLQELKQFETAVIAAKAETPDTAAAIEEKKRPDFVAEFKKNLVDALRLACDAETAILNGKYKDADTIVKNKLSALKSAGHGKFKQDKPEGK